MRKYSAFLLGLSVVASAAHAGVKLRYKSQVGDKSAYQMVMEGETTVFVAERRQKTTLTT